MQQQVGQLYMKAEWHDVPFTSRSLAEAFKSNKFLDSLLLLFDGLYKVKAQYMV